MRAIVEHLLFTAPPISLETSSLSFASLLILFYLPNFLGLTLPPPNTHTRYLSHIFIFIAMSLLSLPVSLPQPIVSVFLLLAALWFCLSCTLSPLCLLRLSVSHPLAHFLFQPFLSSALLPLLLFPSLRKLSQTIPTCDISTLEMRLSDARTSELHIQIHKRAQTLIGLCIKGIRLIPASDYLYIAVWGRSQQHG